MVIVAFLAHLFAVPEQLKQQYTKLKIDQLPIALKEKIWVHRVNSIEKAREVSGTFYGIETDVVFHSSAGVFDVTHPPVVSIGLTLDALMSAVKGQDTKLWIDFKNLSKENGLASLARLNTLCAKHNIDRKDIIVESIFSPLLQPFSLSGYKTSFYIPPLC